MPKGGPSLTPEYFREVVEHSPDMIHSVDADGNILYANETEHKVLGYKNGKLVGKNIRDIYAPETLDEVLKGFKKLKKKGKLHVPEGKMITKDGDILSVEIDSIAVYDDKHHFVRTRSIVHDISDLKDAQEKLKKSRNEYKNLVESALVGVYRTNKKGDILFANKELANILGQPSVKALQKTKSYEYYEDPDDRKRFLEALKKKKFLTSYEVDFVRSDGKKITVLLSAQLNGDELTGMMLDITERKKFVSQYELLAENISDFIWVSELPKGINFLSLVKNKKLASKIVKIASDLEFTYASPSCKKMLGYTPEEFKKLALEDLVDEESYQLSIEALIEEIQKESKKGVKKDRTRTLELRQRHKDGHYFWVEDKMSFIRNNDGRPVGIVGVTRDIDDRKKAEMALKESAQKYRKLAETTREMIFVITPDEIIDYVNRFGANQFNSTPKKLEGKHLKDLFKGQLYKKHSQAIQRVFKAKKPFHSLQKENLAGKEVWLDTWLTPLRDEDGTVTSVMGVSRDVTEHQEAQKKIRQKSFDLNERLKEISLLYYVSDLFRLHGKDVSKVLKQVAKNMPGAWLHPSIAEARITYNEKIYKTPKFRKSKWCLEKDLIIEGDKVGKIELCYRKKPEPYHGKIFLDEERELIDSLAAILSEYLSYSKTQEFVHKLELGFQKSSEVMFMTDPEANIIYVNPAFTKIYGYKPSEVLGENPRILKSGKQDKAFYEWFWGHLKNKKPIETEMINKTKNGETVVLRASVSPILSSKNEVLGYMALQTNVTDLKKLQNQLQESEKKYRDIVENSPNMIHSVDKDGKILFVNRREVEVLGYTRDELIGMDVAKLYSSELKGAVNEGFGSLKEKGHLYISNGKMIKKNGQEIDVEIDSIAIYDDKGNFIRTRSIIRDVTERRQTKQALRETEQRLANLMDNLPGMAYRCYNEKKWTMLYASPGAKELTGYDPMDLINNTKIAYGEIIHPDDQNKVFETVQNAINENKEFKISYRIIDSKGKTKWVWEQGRMVDKSGNKEILEGIINDVTERKKAEEELELKVDQMEFMGRVNLKRHKKMIELEKTNKRLKEQIKKLKANKSK